MRYIEAKFCVDLFYILSEEGRVQIVYPKNKDIVSATVFFA